MQDLTPWAYDPGGKRRSVAFKALSDLKGYRIGGVLGYYYESLFREAGLSVEYVASDEQNFRKLAVGRLDLVPADCATGWRMIKSLFPPADQRNFYTLKSPISKSGVRSLFDGVKDIPRGRNAPGALQRGFAPDEG